jgi:hypothetical protein
MVIMPDWDSLLNPKFIYFILGFIFLSAAVVSACAGKTIARYKGWVYRAKEPSDFWWGVAIYFLGGIFCIGIYLNSVFPESIFHPERWLQLF